MIIKNLKGHSGCKILLCEENNKKFVRKISHNLQYNERLMLQMKKQKNFNSKIVNAPEIFNSGYDKKQKFYFDMEYIGGVTLSRYISLSDINSSKVILDDLFSLCYANHNSYENITKTITEKIIKLPKDKYKSDLLVYKEYCLNFDWSNISTGLCHGDLTFENVIIYNSKIYLIDFLDSFVDSRYIDISKMLQDILCMWSWRNESTSPFIKNILLYEKLVGSLTKNELEIVNRMLIINLLRILPYSNVKTYTFLKNTIKFLGNKFKITR
jgi:thiamine kinase-like enzyme